ncbi:hypothetical protein HNP24_002048 [Chryseobacterium sediminis]|uniref:Uncharacterized protein n=1 Tax=Chryseobacterium sediminis TaxID=1679494 RepID=A0ABR6Q1V2_9FLAO|nr:hypothetical protein [Chryseobacterium sediminis]MBB6331098.1 hypothetical protein [Chryseobacterium sediminis]
MKKIIFTLALIVPTLYFAQDSQKDKKCDLPSTYQEPAPDKKIQSFLKKVDATISDLRKHIAIDNDCNESDVVFLRISEQKGNGIYDVCVKGKSQKYKRMGSVFMKNTENPFDVAK